MTDTSTRSSGRLIGALFLVQMVVGPLAQFGMLGPAITAPPGFLVNAAAHACQVNAGVLLTLVAAACPVGVAIAASPVLDSRSRAAGLWLLALAVVGFMTVVLEGVVHRSMLTLSQEFVRSGASALPQFEPARELIRGLRNALHYTGILVAGCWLLVMYGALMRWRLVPRALGAFGLLACVLLVAGALIPLSGQRPVMWLFLPAGLSQLALVPWLLARGFQVLPQSGRVNQ